MLVEQDVQTSLRKNSHRMTLIYTGDWFSTGDCFGVPGKYNSVLVKTKQKVFRRLRRFIQCFLDYLLHLQTEGSLVEK